MAWPSLLSSHQIYSSLICVFISETEKLIQNIQLCCSQITRNKKTNDNNIYFHRTRESRAKWNGCSCIHNKKNNTANVAKAIFSIKIGVFFMALLFFSKWFFFSFFSSCCVYATKYMYRNAIRMTNVLGKFSTYSKTIMHKNFTFFLSIRTIQKRPKYSQIDHGTSIEVVEFSVKRPSISQLNGMNSIGNKMCN